MQKINDLSRKPFGVDLTIEQLEWINAKRGKKGKNAFIRELVKKAMEGDLKDDKGRKSEENL